MCRKRKPLDASEKNAYARGYQCGVRWPLHKPPSPPQPVVGELVDALRAIRDAVDGELAKFDPDDDLNKRLDPYITRADNALKAVGTWLTE